MDPEPPKDGASSRSLSKLRKSLVDMREIILANVVMASETPSPTFGEENLVRFLFNRFNEGGLDSVSIDEAGNTEGILEGQTGERNILVSAHVDKIWDAKEDHTISVTEKSLSGRGVADNSLGVGVLATLPFILDRLNIRLDANLILLGNTCSFGRGDLKGMRFFLDNTEEKIDSALCLEGIELGRLSYSSLGMFRGEITVTSRDDDEYDVLGGPSSILPLNRIVDSLLAIERPEKPRTAILIGSIEAGSGYSVPPAKGTIRFEVRSESAEVVEKIRLRIDDIIDECRAMDRCDVSLAIVAQRSPGDIGFDHPFVKAARDIFGELNIKPRIAPSISELSALLDKGIPALTLGLTKGDNRHEENETIEIKPVFNGITQLIAMLQYMDNAPDSIIES